MTNREARSAVSDLVMDAMDRAHAHGFRAVTITVIAHDGTQYGSRVVHPEWRDRDGDVTFRDPLAAYALSPEDTKEP